MAATALAAASFAVLYELGSRWGVTRDELSREMPGDEVVPD